MFFFFDIVIQTSRKVCLGDKMIEFLNYFSDILLMFALFIFLAMLGDIIKIVSNYSQFSWYIDQIKKGDISAGTLARGLRGFKNEVSVLIAFVALFIVLALPTLFSQISVLTTELVVLEDKMQQIKFLLNEYPKIEFDELSDEHKRAILSIVYE